MLVYDKITLGVRGDINLIKNRLLSCPDCVFPISIEKNGENDEITYLYFDFDNNLYILDRYLNTIAEYIIDRYEIRFIKRLLSENHNYLAPAQKREVLKNIELFTDDPDIGYNARKQAILLSIYDYLKEDTTMLLDGFVSFRLKEYESILEEVIDRLIDNYVTQKEYEEFIGLLKYFVNIQEPRPKLTHIIVTIDGRYNLLDESGHNITSKCLSDFVDEEDNLTEINYDDLLISMLITLAPEKLVIHGSENIKNKELFTTIKRVFDNNLTYCTGCDICASKAADKKLL